MSIHLCLFLRNSIQSHTAVERVISSLEKTNEVPYPSHNAILHAYLHFEAVMSHDYNFSCVHCGHHPPIVIMDLHKKGVFKMAASDVKEPPPDFKGEVDMEDYWKSVEREILGRGFVKCNRDSPFVILPSYHQWAPWIGPQTRAGHIVANTEYAKVHVSNKSQDERDMDITEERLTNEVMNLKSSASSFFSSFSSISISCSSSNYIPSAFNKSPRNISSSLSSHCSRI
ncbi:uncharacterized protein LOC127526048 [Erpetoichthys calabaricus]|uniref:uncharacterized protein LOC127526048 n=1 Tax=Erpetoichthys calabaricus TaxID=27687 RepID=UPI0022341DD0|nr:uncharacterized protein LOC127526048 [Erpetoichthys calabaricus]